MKRNQTLGGITRIVMCVLDYQIPSYNMLLDDLKDNDISFEDLRKNKEFLNGVMSGFSFREEIEKWFWCQVESGVDLPVLVVNHGDPVEMDHVDEGVDAIQQEIEVSEEDLVLA